MAETAIVVLVPELEPLVAKLRSMFTKDGARGMPPHLTLLYPFADDHGVASRLSELDRTLDGFASFDLSFPATARFPDVLYLRPEPAGQLITLTNALIAAFPEHPPYGGGVTGIVPHLTVAQGNADRFAEIEADLRPSLPVRVRVERVWLMADGPQGWHRHTSFPLNRP